MPEPLSALLMTKVWSKHSCLRALVCKGVRFGVILRERSILTSVFILFRYPSIAREAIGGSQVLFFSERVWFCGWMVSEEMFQPVAPGKGVQRL